MTMEEFLKEKNLYEEYLTWKDQTPEERELEEMKKIDPTGYTRETIYLQHKKEGRLDYIITGINNPIGNQVMKEQLDLAREEMKRRREERKRENLIE